MNFDLVRAAQIVGIGSSYMLSGVICSCSICAIPPLYLAPPSVATKQWALLYSIGSSIAPRFAMPTSLVSFLFLSYHHRGSVVGGMYLAAGLSTFSIVPYTFTTMVGTNHELHDLADGKKEAGKDRVDGLLKKWSRLNYIRSVGPAIGATIALVTALGLFP